MYKILSILLVFSAFASETMGAAQLNRYYMGPDSPYSRPDRPQISEMLFIHKKHYLDHMLMITHWKTLVDKDLKPLKKELEIASQELLNNHANTSQGGIFVALEAKEISNLNLQIQNTLIFAQACGLFAKQLPDNLNDLENVKKFQKLQQLANANLNIHGIGILNRSYINAVSAYERMYQVRFSAAINSLITDQPELNQPCARNYFNQLEHQLSFIITDILEPSWLFLRSLEECSKLLGLMLRPEHMTCVKLMSEMHKFAMTSIVDVVSLLRRDEVFSWSLVQSALKLTYLGSRYQYLNFCINRLHEEMRTRNLTQLEQISCLKHKEVLDESRKEIETEYLKQRMNLLKRPDIAAILEKTGSETLWSISNNLDIPQEHKPENPPVSKSKKKKKKSQKQSIPHKSAPKIQKKLAQQRLNEQPQDEKKAIPSPKPLLQAINEPTPILSLDFQATSSAVLPNNPGEARIAELRANHQKKRKNCAHIRRIKIDEETLSQWEKIHTNYPELPEPDFIDQARRRVLEQSASKAIVKIEAIPNKETPVATALDINPKPQELAKTLVEIRAKEEKKAHPDNSLATQNQLRSIPRPVLYNFRKEMGYSFLSLAQEQEAFGWRHQQGYFPKALNEATWLYAQAANYGNIEAVYYLGLLTSYLSVNPFYIHGQKNMEIYAFSLFMDAAQRGYADAQAMVGQYFLRHTFPVHDQSVTHNKKLARYWLSLAAAQLNPSAIDWLQELNDREILSKNSSKYLSSNFNNALARR